MSTIFNNIPLPIYLVFSFVLPLIFMVFFYRVRRKYPFTLSISIVLGMLLCMLVSFIRVATELGAFTEQLDYFKKTMFYILPITLLLLIVAAFQKTINDPRNRLLAIIGSFFIVIPVVIIAVIIINS
ncbi:hypothetical protein [Paenibacillus endoradicis]|uniref:hypothetical protein n=1 Tax=Paenibacillus endoradicis TaxID=2972487 RepID=UPI0021595CB5|nr:hypothetical protein [Paenibacillus endoradicis]